MTQPSSREFEVGLVLAGAISAGAYTAGVIDFLLEALGEWERERSAGADLCQRTQVSDLPAAVAGHRVRLRVVAGTSAGGMTGAMMLGALANRAEAVTTDPGGAAGNPLFDSWVESIDIESLLGVADLSAYPDGYPRSLLDSTPLDEIARQALRMPASVQPPAFVAEPFHLMLTVTNLRGVPYSLGFEDSRFRHDMLLHADVVHFAFARQFDEKSGHIAYRLPWDELGKAARESEVSLLRQAALATGAFPLGLAPRLLRHRFDPRQPDLYSRRRWRVRRPFSRQAPEDQGEWQGLDAEARDFLAKRPAQWSQLQKIDCSWPVPRPDDYGFLCVDGGVTNNEPMELVRRVLTGDDSFLASDGLATSQAMILVAPFPGGERFASGAYDPEQDLPHVLPTLIGAMKDQLRFKPDELLTAMQDDFFSRFVVAPSRRDPSRGEINGDGAIACGAVGGFSGFFDRGFRAHDYFLGRRNCRNFLLKHFVLPEENPLFDNTYRDQVLREGKSVSKKGVTCLPIIPLYGSAASPTVDGAVPPWPKIGEERLADIRRWLVRRYDGLTDRTIDDLLSESGFARVLARIVRNLTRHDATDWMLKNLRDALRQHGLL